MEDEAEKQNDGPNGEVHTEIEMDENEYRKLLYGVTDLPPFGIIVSVAIQHILMGLGSALTTAYIVSDVICASPDHPIRAKIFCTTLLMTGVCTVLQPLFGVRLPIYQGVCTTFFVPLLAMKNNKEWKCKSGKESSLSNGNMTTDVTTTVNPDIDDEEMYIKLREMMGCLMLASMVEVLAGATGLVGMLLRFIGPITIATSVALIGLSLAKVPIEYSRIHWGMAALCIVVSIVFMLYMDRIYVPCLTDCPRRKKDGKESKPVMRIPIFQMFPVLLSTIVTWLVSGILTAAGAFSDDPDTLEYRARTDVRINMIHSTPWFYVPYPGQFGSPLFNTTLFVGFISAVISSILETIGDYYAAATICKVPPPPTHAVNRGVMMEGIGSVLSGAVGAGHATTSYTVNIALIGISRVASRSSLTAAGIISIILSLIGKLGAVLASLPDPVIGGSMFVVFGILSSLGIFTLRMVDMTSSRNLAIFGIALYTGIVFPEWLDEYPNAFGEDAGPLVDILKGIIGTPMFLGAIVAAILDNTVRGTNKERGFHTRTLDADSPGFAESREMSNQVYNIQCLNRLLIKVPCLQRIPFVQTLISKPEETTDNHA